MNWQQKHIESPDCDGCRHRYCQGEAAFGFLDLPSLRGIESACSTVGTKMGCLMIRTKLPCSLRAHNLLERIPVLQEQSYRNKGYFSNSIWLSGFRSLERIYLVVGMSWRKLGLRRSFLRAMASIWRILSRVIPNTLPVSSSV